MGTLPLSSLWDLILWVFLIKGNWDSLCKLRAAGKVFSWSLTYPCTFHLCESIFCYFLLYPFWDGFLWHGIEWVLTHYIFQGNQCLTFVCLFFRFLKEQHVWLIFLFFFLPFFLPPFHFPLLFLVSSLLYSISFSSLLSFWP